VTIFTIVTPGPYEAGRYVSVHDNYGLPFQGYILRVASHELLVRVGGKPLAFQEHEPGIWSWCQPEQTSFDVGDKQQGRLV